MNWNFDHSALLPASRNNLWECFSKDQAAHMRRIQEGMWESQVDGTGFVQATARAEDEIM